jgi:pentachlorophenol monooxygenase/3-(3-hydroxy-phenyl)propionate hydroxylase
VRVAVIGNGPVGQSTALLLARWGVPVTLLDERAERDAAGSKSICQQGDVLDIWDSVGAGRAIAAEGVTWTCARTYYRGRELFSYTPGRSGASFPPFVNLSQSRTEQILDERIAAEPLIDVRWNSRVTGIAQDGNGVTISAMPASGVTASGMPVPGMPVPGVTVSGMPASGQDIRADYAVACAGARGDPVREMLGVEFSGHSFADKFLICDIKTELPGWADERRFYFDPPWNPGRQVLIHPCPGSTFRIDWQVPGDYDLRSDALDARIRTVIGTRPYRVIWHSVYRFQSKIVDRMRVGRVLLAGDCAHVFSPFGARGLNSGVADAENAAWKLACVLRGWAGPDLLESYHAERHAAALENLAVTRATMEFLVPQDDEQRERRRTVLAGAASDPELRAMVDSGRLAEPFWYAASPLTTPDPARPFAGRPPRGALPALAPGVLIPDVPVPFVPAPVPGVPAPDVPMPGRYRLRALARAGFVLLGADHTNLDHVTAIPMDDGLRKSLDARPGELWLIRPDAHVAAILRDPSHVLPALRRTLGSAAR